MEQSKVIKEKLLSMGEDYDALKPFMKAHLEKVESFIQDKQNKQAEALSALREAEYNVSEIAKALDYSRTTLYNHNQLLKRYIEYSLELDSKRFRSKSRFPNNPSFQVELTAPKPDTIIRKATLTLPSGVEITLSEISIKSLIMAVVLYEEANTWINE